MLIGDRDVPIRTPPCFRFPHGGIRTRQFGLLHEAIGTLTQVHAQMFAVNGNLRRLGIGGNRDGMSEQTLEFELGTGLRGTQIVATLGEHEGFGSSTSLALAVPAAWRAAILRSNKPFSVTSASSSTSRAPAK